MRNRQKYPREPRLRLRFLTEELGNNPSYRGGDWERQRKLALARAKDRCEACGRGVTGGVPPLPQAFAGDPHSRVRLSVHHIMGYSYGGSNDLSNLKVLCQDCHPALDSYRSEGWRGEVR